MKSVFIWDEFGEELSKANDLMLKEDWDEALLLFEGILNDQARGLSSVLALLVSLQAIIARVNKGDNETAKKHVSYCLELLERKNEELNTSEVSILLNETGVQLFNTGLFEQASEFFQRAIQIDRIRKDMMGVARASNNLAFVFVELGRKQPKLHEKAAKLFKIASGLSKEDFVQRSLNSAHLFYQLGKYETAVKSLTTASTKLMLEEDDEESVQVVVLAQVATLREFLQNQTAKDPQEIIKAYVLLVKNLEFVGHRRKLSEELFNLGNFLEKQDMKSEAEKNWFRARKISQRGKSNPMVFVKSSLKLAFSAFVRGELNKAEDLLKPTTQLQGINIDGKLEEQVSALLKSINNLKESTATREVPKDASEEKIVILDEAKQIRESLDESVSELIETPISTEELLSVIPETPQDDIETVLGENLTNSDSPEPARASLDLDHARTMVDQFLTEKGYNVTSHLSKIPNQLKNAGVDLVASKGKLRKKKLLISLATNTPEAEVSGYLLSGLKEEGEKIIFLLSGDSTEIVSKDIKVIKSINDLVTEPQ